MEKNHLVILAKKPRLGYVKRRLAQDIGKVRALNFYRTNLFSLVRRMKRDNRWCTWLAITPNSALKVDSCWPKHVRRISQGGGDLGERMSGLVRKLPVGKIIIIGSDIPEITADLISRGFRSLSQANLIFGPARDGGYWLIGFDNRSRKLQVFSNVRWSTSHALGDTVYNIPPCARVAYLPKLDDIDTGVSFDLWRRRIAVHYNRLSCW
ncbi:MAG: hypothetical protein CFH06_00355 [Alphaproteobacteria bacterium MarineAlpha3_Bin5]|nr:hypothetical protein [Magnetovibrio sp.]PPR79458.1 MAG: hypothetical protein CFH06_00355 [Alphaproteobacteria bacterium MarineAlpha3_Bin5]|tara:strand:+ start:200 stop:826 length:627 start_codon:yes stop_codon:yes gene_type:complete